MRTLREAGAGGVEPPSTVLETVMLPVTPCSRDSIDFLGAQASRLHGLLGIAFVSMQAGRLRSQEVYATSMLSEGIEPPMTAWVA